MTNGNQVATGMRLVQSGFVASPNQDVSIVATVVPEAEPVETMTATPEVSPIQDLPDNPIDYGRPSWLVPVILASLAILFLIVGYLLVTAVFKKRASHANLDE